MNTNIHPGLYASLSLFVTILLPSQATTLKIYPDTLLELKAGPHSVSSVDREVYFRTYHIPGMFNDDLASDLQQLRISPARGTGPYFGNNGGDELQVYSPTFLV